MKKLTTDTYIYSVSFEVSSFEIPIRTQRPFPMLLTSSPSTVNQVSYFIRTFERKIAHRYMNTKLVYNALD